MNKFPNLFIIGVFKAGTTSLFHYLNQHPDVCGANKKETHFFSPLIYNNSELAPLEEYKRFFSNCTNTKFTMEATPSYLYGGKHLIPLFKQNFGDHKILLLLRNPVDRFLSYYKFIKTRSAIPESESIQEFLEKCIKEHNNNYDLKIGTYSNAIKEGMYATYLQDWVNNYQPEDFSICFFDDLVHPKDLLLQISDWLNIDKEFYEHFSFTVENKTVMPKYAGVHKQMVQLNKKFETFFRQNPRIKRTLRKFYFSFNEAKHQDGIPTDVTTMLNNIYKEPNKSLKLLLTEYRVSTFPKWLN